MQGCSCTPQLTRTSQSRRRRWTPPSEHTAAHTAACHRAAGAVEESEACMSGCGEAKRRRACSRRAARAIGCVPSATDRCQARRAGPTYGYSPTRAHSRIGTAMGADARAAAAGVARARRPADRRCAHHQQPAANSRPPASSSRTHTPSLLRTRARASAEESSARLHAPPMDLSAVQRAAVACPRCARRRCRRTTQGRESVEPCAAAAACCSRRCTAPRCAAQPPPSPCLRCTFCCKALTVQRVARAGSAGQCCRRLAAVWRPSRSVARCRRGRQARRGAGLRRSATCALTQSWLAQVLAVSISSNDFKPGVFIEVDGAPYRILGASLDWRRAPPRTCVAVAVHAARADVACERAPRPVL
jgi:hypothetical protein